ncbi:MAG: prepilin-type N-terminal cleavage/methylation domain-containing protein [Opitutaceae bacterium]|jgi:general secretion pathway protein G|nr:prepilin-type N-terminal cleavage/methylation domain-containing protein [Opitutaceae bacterium]
MIMPLHAFICSRRRAESKIENRESKISRAWRGAFTLVELLTVIAIIGILAAILVPTVSKVRETAKVARDISNARQVAISILLYRDENRDAVPERGQDGNINGWIEKLRESNPSLRQWGQFEAQMDKVIRTDPEKERRSLSINKGIINNFSYGKKTFKTPVTPSRTILLANNCAALSVIPGGEDTWSSGCMEVFGSDAVTKLYRNGKACLFGYMDGHVNIIIFKSSEQYWGSPWHNIAWNGQ